MFLPKEGSGSVDPCLMYSRPIISNHQPFVLVGHSGSWWSGFLLFPEEKEIRFCLRYLGKGFFSWRLFLLKLFLFGWNYFEECIHKGSFPWLKKLLVGSSFASCWRLVTISSVTIACTKYLFKAAETFGHPTHWSPYRVSLPRREGVVSLACQLTDFGHDYTPKPKSRLCVPTPETLTIYIGSMQYAFM